MAAKFTAAELRVLGVLIEKSLTQPGSYPLTLNALVLGCNQKQNRDPVVEFGESDVSRAIHTLQLKGLVKQAPPLPGARANRFQHHVVEALHWDRREQAIMAELMVRGRQTPGELRTNASRMTGFADLPAVLATLEALMRYTPPYVEELAREPGRSANRYRHLLGDETAGATEVVAAVASAVAPAALAQPAAQAATKPAGASQETQEGDDLSLGERVMRLEEQVAALTRRVDALQRPPHVV